MTGAAARSRLTGAAVLVALAAAATTIASPVLAGPPLISDDPHTVGSGRFEAILSVDSAEAGDFVILTVPTFDLTLGLIDGFDATLIAAPVFEFESGESTHESGVVQPGVKWALLKSNNWAASFSPAVAITANGSTQVDVGLPIQVEFSHDGVAIGSDVGYLVVTDGPDGWRMGVYGTWSPITNWTLMAELRGLGVPANDAEEWGIGVGFDWEALSATHLLFSAGTGVSASHVERTDWTLYVGMQWDLDAW